MRDALERGWEDRTVTVSRDKLLKTLEENRTKHVAEYREALVGYKKAASGALEKQIAKAKKAIEESAEILLNRIEQFDPEDPLKNQVVVLDRFSFNLEVPQNHERSYDVAIAMAQWEEGDTIELKQSEFQCFVLDDWDWKEQFLNVTKVYNSPRR